MNTARPEYPLYLATLIFGLFVVIFANCMHRSLIACAQMDAIVAIWQ